MYALTGALTGADATLDIEDGNGRPVAIFERLANGGFAIRDNFVNGSETDYSFTSATPLAWHQLEIVSDLNGLTYNFDGVTVISDSSDTSGFQVVGLGVGNSSAGTEYFDNFGVMTTPEPSTCLLVGGSLLVLASRRRRIRQEWQIR